MRCFSPCLAIPTGPNGDPPGMGIGMGKRFGSLRLTETVRGMRNGEWGGDGGRPPRNGEQGGDGGRPPGPARPVDWLRFMAGSACHCTCGIVIS